MKIILQETVSHLGEIGDVINVKDGYARNYLLPRGIATMATAQEMARLASRQKQILAEREKSLTAAEEAAARLKGAEVSIAVKVSEEGHLYGSVGVTEIAKALQEKGFAIEKRQVLIPEPIRTLGKFQVPIRFHTDVSTEISVDVIQEKIEA